MRLAGCETLQAKPPLLGTYRVGQENERDHYLLS